MKTPILIIILSLSTAVLGQGIGLRNVNKPQFEKNQPVKIGKSSDNTYNNSTITHQQSNTTNQYGSALQPKKAEEMINYGSANNSPNNIYESLNKGNYTLGANAFIPPKQISSVTRVKSLVNEIQRIDRSISYQLPSLQTSAEVKYFYQAYREIVDMLEGRKPLNLKRAVFLTENAWFGGGMKYEDYNRMLSEMTLLIQLKMQQEGLPLNDNQAINYMAHRYMSDTLKIDLKVQEKVVTSYPKTYDFDDPFGYKDVRKMFVSKLMFENSGQCKSLPLLYLILIESLGGTAYLSFSPSHSYIKCVGNNGELYNLELTNGTLTSDSWVTGSGYVKSEAVKSGIFLDTLNKKQVIANCLIDLTRYYKWRYGKNDIQQGYDNFSAKCINQTLKYHPNNIHAILEKANYKGCLLTYIGNQVGCRNKQELMTNPKTSKSYRQLNQLYALTDGLGYEPMPQKAYTDWLKTLDEEQQKQEHNKQYIKFSTFTTNY